MLGERLKQLGIRPVFNDYANLSPADTHTFEETLAAKLPDDFKELLQQFGQSRFTGFATVKSNGREYAFRLFYGGADARPSYNILKNRGTQSDQLPNEFLPFAMDDFGNEYCMSLDGSERGAVFFWDTESGKLDRLASSVEELLGLIEIEEAE